MTKNNDKPYLPDPRGCAVRALEWVFVRHLPLDHFFAGDQGFLALPVKDRALARAITGTTLRRLGQVDAIIDTLLAKPLPRQAKTARQILRAGIAELLFLRSAAHGVVHSFVGLAGRWRAARPYKGLINALFRRVTREQQQLLADVPLVLNIPDWPGENWDKLYGEGTREHAAQSLIEAPFADLTVFKDAQAWATKLEGQKLGTQTVRLSTRGRIEKIDGYDEGGWIVQDLGAALPVHILAPKPTENILDMCAAPGGKTMQLAAAGANVTALDNKKARMVRVEENLKRTKLSAKLICADARKWTSETQFDAVLLDAPCSATGVFRHHPDVHYNHRASDLDELNANQLLLAQQAGRLLKPGGRLVYCVCSAEPQEGEDIITKLLEDCDLTLDPISQQQAAFAEVFLKDGMLRIPPGSLLEQGGIDAFFIARLRKA